VARKSNVGQPLVQASLVGEAIEGGPVAVFVLDEEMRYVAVNGYACELLGYEREELLARTAGDLAAGADSSAVFERLVADGSVGGRGAVRRRDGGTVLFEYRAQATQVAGMQLYVSVGWPVEEPATARRAPRRRDARGNG
jgi:PAS domain S-box-containing protein